MKLHQLMPLLLHTFKSEHDLLKAIEELSAKFTKDRQNISDYLKDERLTSAYTAFYLTTNMPKLEAVFEWMPKQWLQGFKDATFIDLGAGPGTFSLAFREYVGAPVKIQQIETSAVMRDQAKKLWEGLYPGEPLVTKAEGEKVLFFGHSANEMGPDVALRYIRDLDPDHILFIEPGTKDFFPKMLTIRDELIKKNYNILYPCPTSETCPLKGSAEDWCHQYIQVKQDSEVERLSQIARKDRRHLPLIVHAFSKTFKSTNPTSRVIRVLPETKFSYEWEACELNQLKHYQIMKRGMSKATLNVLSETLAGAALETEVEKELEKSKRVKIKMLNNRSLES